MTSKNERFIHPTAIVDQNAIIGEGVYVGPYSIIGPSVTLKDHVTLDSHVVIQGRTTIGPRTRIHSFASIGCRPQDLKYEGEDTALEVGSDNMIREYVNLSIGTTGGGGITKIGSKNLFMVNVHVAHDCIIGDSCIFANGVSLGGHVTIGNKAVLGGHSAVHQFVHLGDLSMTGGGSIVVQDVPPFCMVHGNHASINGLNLLGLKRHGLTSQGIREIKNMYKLVFSANLTVTDAINQIQETVEDSPERELFVSFLRQSTRGICR